MFCVVVVVVFCVFICCAFVLLFVLLRVFHFVLFSFVHNLKQTGPKCFDSQYSAKYFLWCFAKESNSCRFGTK